MHTETLSRGAVGRASTAAGVARWWPLVLITLLAAALRLWNLGSQSLWFDEAFTAVRTLHPSLQATLHSMVRTENSPFLWYVIEWLDYRLLGSSEFALRLPSALFGIATVPLAWAAAREAAGRRAALVAAALVAVGPLFVWYSQEARVYSLYAMLGALATFAFVRVLHERPRATALLAISGALCLTSHYFAFFLLAPMSIWILVDPRLRSRAWPAVATFVVVGVALIPLLTAQGGHYTQWIGEWTLSERVLAIGQYWLLGESGAPLGHSIELLVAVPFVIGGAVWVFRALQQPPRAARREREGVFVMLVLWAPAVIVPVGLALAGLDYLTPRNVIAEMVPLTVMLAIMLASRSTGAVGVVCTLAAVAALLFVTLDVTVNHRLQRGDWRGVAGALSSEKNARAITSVHLGTTPLQYYLGPLNVLPAGSAVRVREVDEVGYPPLVYEPQRPPAAGFKFVGKVNENGLFAYRFRAARARVVTQQELVAHSIMAPRAGEAAEVLVAPGVELVK